MKNPNLPEEILLEIFSRLPPNSVGRFRCLSKLWRRNLSTSQFAKLHLKAYKTDQKDAIFVSHRNRCVNTIRINGDDEVVASKLDLPTNLDYVIGSCNGLVLMMNKDDELFVVNPLTLQQVSIRNTPDLVPDEDKQYASYAFGFGYDSCCDDFKIVKFTQVLASCSYVEVYSMRNDSWRRLGYSPYKHGFYCYDGVFVNGAVHWLAWDDDDDEFVIEAFDVATESFRAIPVPNIKSHQADSYIIYAIAGGLLLLNLDDYHYYVDVWIMKEYGQVNSWTNFQIYSPHRDYARKPLCYSGENEVVFTTQEGTLLMCNLIEGTTKEIDVDGVSSEINGACMFVASLVSPFDIAR